MKLLYAEDEPALSEAVVDYLTYHKYIVDAVYDGADAYMGNIPLMFLFTGVAAFGMGPWQGDMNAVIAECSRYTYLTKGKRVDGTMYSCTSLGVKLGGGLGVAIQGWLLEFAGYDGSLAVQPDSAIRMLQTMYLWIPVVITIIITFIMSRMKVEKANIDARKN